jgi:hypothetical protein
MLFQSKNLYTSAIIAETLALMFSGISAFAGSEILNPKFLLKKFHFRQKWSDL